MGEGAQVLGGHGLESGGAPTTHFPWVLTLLSRHMSRPKTCWMKSIGHIDLPCHRSGERVAQVLVGWPRAGSAPRTHVPWWQLPPSLVNFPTGQDLQDYITCITREGYKWGKVLMTSNPMRKPSKSLLQWGGIPDLDNVLLLAFWEINILIVFLNQEGIEQ